MLAVCSVLTNAIPPVFTLVILEGEARYAGILLAQAKGFGQGFFWPSGRERAFYTILAQILIIFGDQ